MNDLENQESTGSLTPHTGGTDDMQLPSDDGPSHYHGEPYGLGDPNLRHKAIYIVGPSSSGKTTLCDAFAADSGIPPSIYIKEIARNVMTSQGFTRAEVGTFKMQSAIMVAQLCAEAKSLEEDRNATKTGSPLLLSDRSAVDPTVYARSSGGTGGRDMQLKLLQTPEFQAALPFYRRSLFGKIQAMSSKCCLPSGLHIVMLNPVPEWIKDDGVRSLEDPWQYCNYLRDTLRELTIPFREVGEDVKDIDDRVRLVRRWMSWREC